MKVKTPLLDEFVCFQTEIKDFYYFSEKLPLFQNLYATSEGAVSHNVLNYQQLSNARCQVSFKLIFVLSNYQTCTLPLNK